MTGKESSNHFFLDIFLTSFHIFKILLFLHTLSDTAVKKLLRLAYGVTGNTSDFGSEESRFEP